MYRVIQNISPCTVICHPLTKQQSQNQYRSLEYVDLVIISFTIDFWQYRLSKILTDKIEYSFWTVQRKSLDNQAVLRIQIIHLSILSSPRVPLLLLFRQALGDSKEALGGSREAREGAR